MSDLSQTIISSSIYDLKQDSSSFTDDFRDISKSKIEIKSLLSKRRKSKRCPMRTLGDRRVGSDLSCKKANSQHLHLGSMNQQDKTVFFDKLFKDMVYFLQTATDKWSPSEECRRYTVMGECITCVRWEDKFLISTVDIVKSILNLFRISNMGQSPTNFKKFDEGIHTDLRSIKVGDGAILEESNSSLLKYLYRINSVRTHKRQKIFLWHAVPFLNLLEDAIKREQKSNQIGVLNVPKEISRQQIIGPTFISFKNPLSKDSINDASTISKNDKISKISIDSITRQQLTKFKSSTNDSISILGFNFSQNNANQAESNLGFSPRPDFLADCEGKKGIKSQYFDQLSILSPTPEMQSRKIHSEFSEISNLALVADALMTFESKALPLE